MACVQFNEKKGQESPVKGHNYHPYFFLDLRHFQSYNPLC